MPKEEIHAFWNYLRIINTIPEKAFEKDMEAKKMLECFLYLQSKYMKLMSIVNSREG